MTGFGYREPRRLREHRSDGGVLAAPTRPVPSGRRRYTMVP